MADWKMIDADGHIREIESDVFEYLPEHYKKRRDAVLYFPLLPHHGWHRQAGHGGTGSSFLIPTLQDWQRALDQGNIEAAVVYPTRFMHIGQVGMTDFAVDLSRAYNDYLYDRFLRHESRLKGIAILPLQDVPAAVSELRRAVREYGMVGAVLPADGLPRPLGHPEFHPVTKKPIDSVACSPCIHRTRCAITISSCGAAKRQRSRMSGRRCGSSRTLCFPVCWANMPISKSLSWKRAVVGCPT